MAESKLHKPTPLEELMQQSLPEEAYETQPTYSRPYRDPNANLPTGPISGPSGGPAPAPTGGIQETRRDIGQQAAQENVSKQLSQGTKPQDEIRPGTAPVGAIKPTTREQLMGPSTGPVETPKPRPGPEIVRRFSGQETISTEERLEQERLAEMGRKQYETPLRHSLMVSEALVGKPEEHKDPIGQIGATTVEFIITLPAHTVMAPVEIPRTAVATGQAIQEKGLIPWAQESYRYVMEKPGVRLTQLVLVAGTVLLPIGAKFVRGRIARSTVRARALESDVFLERGGDVTRGVAKTDITYSTGEKSFVYTEAVSRRAGKDLIETRARSIGAEKGKISRIESRSVYRKGDIEPFREVSGEVSVSKAAGGKVIEGKIHEAGGIRQEVIKPGTETHFAVTRITPSRGKPTGTVEAGTTRTVIELDTGKIVYKKRVAGEIMGDVDLNGLPKSPEPVIRPGPGAASGKRITPETEFKPSVAKTTLDAHVTESAMSKQISQFSKTRSVRPSRTGPRTGPVTTTTGPDSPLIELQEPGYPGPEVKFEGPSRSGFDQLGPIDVIRPGPGILDPARTTRMAVLGSFRVRSVTGQVQKSGQDMRQSQAMQEIQAIDQSTLPDTAVRTSSASARATKTRMIEELTFDMIPIKPAPIMSPRGFRGRGVPPFFLIIERQTGKVITVIRPGQPGKRRTEYQPTIGGIVSGRVISKTPRGAWSGLERRFPVKRKKRRKLLL